MQTHGATAARLLAAAFALFVWGPTPARGEAILVGAAVSLREPATEIAARFSAGDPVPIDLTVGASSMLAAQIRAGAPIDVFVSADERIVEALAADGLIARGGRTVVARNELVVVARADLGFALRRADDLLRPEVRRIAVPEYAVPVGRYAREWLGRRGLLERLEPRLVPTEHARATLAAVDFGHADAAIVYATDARLARFARIAFQIPPAEQPRIVYAAAVIAHSSRPAAAARFLRFLESPAAAKILAAAGFSPPAGRRDVRVRGAGRP